MLTVAKTTLMKLLSSPEVQAAVILLTIEFVARGSTGAYDRIMDKAAQHVAAEIKKQKTVLT